MNKERNKFLENLDFIALKEAVLTKTSNWTLIISNLAIIFFAIIDKIPLLEILWIYWIQSVIIGIFNFIKILSLEDFSTEGLKQGNSPVPVTKSAKISTAVFFLFHYGFFHFIYAVFLFTGVPEFSDDKSDANLTFLIISTILFVINYTFEFFSYLKEREPKPNLGKMMFSPYGRIIPMHLTIIFGGFAGAMSGIFSVDSSLAIITFFVLLKTIIDLITHNAGTILKKSLKGLITTKDNN